MLNNVEKYEKDGVIFLPVNDSALPGLSANIMYGKSKPGFRPIPFETFCISIT